MMRRLYTAVVILMLSGLMPLAFAVGFCATKPCCHLHADASSAFLDIEPKCCETVSDFSAHSEEATSAKTTLLRPQLVDSDGPVQAVFLPVRQACTHDRVGSGPPHPRQRLATLSILLI
jgi:hypothetical protein